ncbi:MAG: hypothetical protein IKJ76_00120 [Fibrobacter sp.]|jgi:hypothetical protein|nr:hypothetical protein [Fibrobacter sp.]
MLNLFKHQWLPDYIRDYIVKKFPAQHFKVTFEINGHEVPMDQVVGNERHVKRGNVTYTDTEGNSTTNWLFLYKGEISFNSVDRAVDNFTLDGIEPGIRKLPRVGKKGEVEKYRKELKKKLSDAMDYCPGSFLDQLHDYPITDMPRWRRKRILNLLANMSEDGIPAFVSFDLDNAALSQLEQFNEDLELAMMVENKYEPELDE